MTTAEATTAPAAKKAATFGKRICPECGETFTAKHPSAQFCTPAHKLAFHNRAKGRSHVIAYAMAWRGSRNAKAKKAEGETQQTVSDKRRAALAKADRRRTIGKAAFSEMCRLLDQFAAEDRAAGRPTMEAYVSGLERRQLWAQSTAYK
ncbi:hypothetical protein W2_gp028c [Caulobacter phage W2]|uniref:Uncharacterized protein n=1 Tax=Caulobacter phage TMCBR4 TaxID=3028191 RepID=A0AAE9ZJ41_9CAUD|nr:hypothetical protein TMCBR4_gp029c [Caulobacter phage TMCBR4]WDS38396.1 hypothetical protein W2_gp028c [Caulobacter phage W2]